MNILFKKTIYLLMIGLLSACSFSTPQSAGSSDNEAKTLASLKQVDDHPLYTMTYYGDYPSPRTSMLPAARQAGPAPSWACSLFTVLIDEDHLLYGRNFDWQFSPAVLLFTHPSDGYASVSMVDIEYLGFSQPEVLHLTDLPPEKLSGLLNAPQIPFDGMNDQGLAIGMAAVDPGNMQSDPSRQTIGSLGILREILDHAREVDEALDLIKKYNIDFVGGPPLHYLIADASKRAVLVEFYQGEIHVFENEQPWHSATNFLRSSVKDPKGNCWRYDRINDRLNETRGSLDSRSAMELLSQVAQDSTQWSVVYQMKRGAVSVAMGKDYANVRTFRVSDYFESK
jgi:hypothetical protein